MQNNRKNFLKKAAAVETSTAFSTIPPFNPAALIEQLISESKNAEHRELFAIETSPSRATKRKKKKDDSSDETEEEEEEEEESEEEGEKKKKRGNTKHQITLASTETRRLLGKSAEGSWIGVFAAACCCSKAMIDVVCGICGCLGCIACVGGGGIAEGALYGINTLVDSEGMSDPGFVSTDTDTGFYIAMAVLGLFILICACLYLCCCALGLVSGICDFSAIFPTLGTSAAANCCTKRTAEKLLNPERQNLISSSSSGWTTDILRTFSSGQYNLDSTVQGIFEYRFEQGDSFKAIVKRFFKEAKGTVGMTLRNPLVYDAMLQAALAKNKFNDFPKIQTKYQLLIIKELLSSLQPEHHHTAFLAIHILNPKVLSEFFSNLKRPMSTIKKIVAIEKRETNNGSNSKFVDIVSALLTDDENKQDRSLHNIRSKIKDNRGKKIKDQLFWKLLLIAETMTLYKAQRSPSSTKLDELKPSLQDHGFLLHIIELINSPNHSGPTPYPKPTELFRILLEQKDYLDGFSTITRALLGGIFADNSNVFDKLARLLEFVDYDPTFTYALFDNIAKHGMLDKNYHSEFYIHLVLANQDTPNRIPLITEIFWKTRTHYKLEYRPFTKITLEAALDPLIQHVFTAKNGMLLYSELIKVLPKNVNILTKTITPFVARQEKVARSLQSGQKKTQMMTINIKNRLMLAGALMTHLRKKSPAEKLAWLTIYIFRAWEALDSSNKTLLLQCIPKSYYSYFATTGRLHVNKKPVSPAETYEWDIFWSLAQAGITSQLIQNLMPLVAPQVDAGPARKEKKKDKKKKREEESEGEESDEEEEVKEQLIQPLQDPYSNQDNFYFNIQLRPNEYFKTYLTRLDTELTRVCGRNGGYNQAIRKILLGAIIKMLSRNGSLTAWAHPENLNLTTIHNSEASTYMKVVSILLAHLNNDEHGPLYNIGNNSKAETPIYTQPSLPDNTPQELMRIRAELLDIANQIQPGVIPVQQVGNHLSINTGLLKENEENLTNDLII